VRSLWLKVEAGTTGLATALACAIESERPTVPGDAGVDPTDAAPAPLDSSGTWDASAKSDAGPDAARPDTGIAETGADASLEQLLAGVAPYTWIALPGSLMKDVCPGPYSSYPCVAVQTAWSGAAWDDAHDRLYVLGGGHGDSFYNMPFEYDLGALRWRRLGDLPEGATGSKATAGMRYVPLETCGFYPKEPFSPPDGGMGVTTDPQGYVAHSVCADPAFRAQFLDLQQPRSSHTYGKLLFDGERHRLPGRRLLPQRAGLEPPGLLLRRAKRNLVRDPTPGGQRPRGPGARWAGQRLVRGGRQRQVREARALDVDLDHVRRPQLQRRRQRRR